MAKDPVCGMQVAVESAKWTIEHEGKHWYFCGQGCRKKFVSDPERYDGKGADVATSGLALAAADTTATKSSCCGSKGGHAEHTTAIAPAGAAGGYVCPMHPEVRSEKMGACIKCGMALEPVSPV